MSWRKPDLNPDTNIQQYQSDRLALQTKLLPNTDKTGSGIYLSPLLSADGKLQVDVNTAPAASNFTTFNQSLFDAVSVAAGHASNGTELDVSSRTGTFTIYGTLTSKLAYSLALQLSLDITNWFNSATHILLDDDLSTSRSTSTLQPVPKRCGSSTQTTTQQRSQCRPSSIPKVTPNSAAVIIILPSTIEMSQSLFLGHDYTNNTVKRIGVSSGGSIKTEPATEKTIAAAFSGSVADAAESSEIDMSGHKHLHIYGEIQDELGFWQLCLTAPCLQRRGGRFERFQHRFQL